MPGWGQRGKVLRLVFQGQHLDGVSELIASHPGVTARFLPQGANPSHLDADVTFLLTSGGHNAGVVAPPDEPGHSYQVMTKAADAPYVDRDEWMKLAPHSEGSWWLEWSKWLVARSGEVGEPPRMGFGKVDSLPDAPGDYVHT